MKPDTTVCVFAKEPRPGLVKTRLIPAVGAEGAAALAAAFIEDTLSVVESLGTVRLVVAYDGSDAAHRFGPSRTVWPQGDGDIGERMERVLARALADASIAIAIGSDLPGFPAGAIEDARLRLTAGADAAMGPSDDGGYYLLGLRRCPRGLLAGLPWSVATTRVASERRFFSLGLRVVQVAGWFDVDRPEDLDRLRDGIVRGSIVAPATRRALAELALLGEA